MLELEEELNAVEVRIDAGVQLISDQEARIEQMRKQGLDVRSSIKLLQQFHFSLSLLSDTRELIRWEIKGTKSRGVRILARERLKLSQA